MSLQNREEMVDTDMMQQAEPVQNYLKIQKVPSGMSVRQNRYDFQDESHFYVDVLTKGGDLCETHEDGTYVIVGDGSDEDESAEEEPDQEMAESPTASPPKGLDSQYKQTQGQQQSPKHDSDSNTEIEQAEPAGGDGEP